MNGVEIKWESVRHRVAIGGWVTDAETRKPIPGAAVTIDAMPVSFKRTLQLKSIQHGTRWETSMDRPDRTTTRADGCFHFLDLPAGQYTLRVSIPSAGNRCGSAQAEATVAPRNENKTEIAVIPIALPSTTVKGRITTEVQKNGLYMAEVRVKGSGERTFSDLKGEYVLAGIEPGRRRIQVFAQGYNPTEEQANLKAPGDSYTLNFALAKAAS